jgi:hypothetical protein
MPLFINLFYLIKFLTKEMIFQLFLLVIFKIYEEITNLNYK